MSAFLFKYLSVCLSCIHTFWVSVSVSFLVSVLGISICLSLCLSKCLSVSLFKCIRVFLMVCLSFFLAFFFLCLFCIFLFFPLAPHLNVNFNPHHLIIDLHFCLDQISPFLYELTKQTKTIKRWLLDVWLNFWVLLWCFSLSNCSSRCAVDPKYLNISIFWNVFICSIQVVRI